MKELEFNAYRYFMVQEEQLTLFDREREDVVSDFITLLRSNAKVITTHRNRRYLLYLIKELEASVLICKLARERHYIRHDEGERDIQTEEEIDYPFLYIIISFPLQIILIQKKTTVFSNMDTAKEVLAQIISTAVNFVKYRFNIDEITHKKRIWEMVEASDFIYWIRLNLKSPNLFGARFEANEFLKKQRDLHNASEVGIEFKNDHGRLKITKEIFESFIDYISAGAGKYVVKLRTEGSIRLMRSRENIKKVFFKGDPMMQTEELVIKTIHEVDEE